MNINQEHTVLPNGEVQIGDLVIGRGGFALIEAAKKYRANMAKIRLAEMMEEAMKKEKLNQVDLAKYLGVTKQAVNKMLNGSTNFTVETLIRLEEVLYADFISSALYKDEAMRREYGVHYAEGDDFDYVSAIPYAVSKHFDSKVRLELGMQDLVSKNVEDLGHIKAGVLDSSGRPSFSESAFLDYFVDLNPSAGESSYAMAA